MKFLIVFSVIAAVASAGYLKPTGVTAEVAEIQEIIAAINSPSTDPATAAALEQMLFETLGIAPVVEDSPISVGPALVEFDHDGGALTAVEAPAPVEAPVVPAPAAVAEAADALPLVQIILNINQASAAGVAPSPAETPVIVDTPVAVSPVIVVDTPVDPVSVVDEAVNVVDSPVAPAPVVIAPAPAPIVIAPAPAPVVVAPAPVQTLPDILN